MAVVRCDPPPSHHSSFRQRVSGKPHNPGSRACQPWLCSTVLTLTCVLLLIHPVPISGQIDFEDCTGYSSCDETCKQYYFCGSVSFEYPFWFKGPKSYHRSFCGYKDFEVTCQNQTATYTSSSGATYIITGNNRLPGGTRETTLYLTDSQFVSATSCPKPSSREIDFQIDNNYYPASVVKLVFFYNCSANHSVTIPAQNRVGCLQNTTGLTYVFSEDDPALWKVNDELTSLCRGGIVKSPVLKAAVADRDLGTAYGKVLALGFEFLLGWKPGSRDAACNRCEASNGWCSYGNDTGLGSTFRRCHCSDGWHKDYCRRGLSERQKALIGVGSTIIVLIVCAFLYCQYYIFCYLSVANSEARAMLQMMETFLETQGPLALTRYKYSELKKITDSFTVKLGKGGYGTVYKGKLPNSSQVAVKVLQDFRGNGDEFLNEVATIGRTNHINIVSLLGYCFEGTKRALIYEYMPNGSLDKFLFAENSTTTHNLEWEQLYKIALGIAKGLEYLHKGCKTRIIHFDIKPHNILLDEDFCPKISDFGLAQSCAPKMSVLSMAGTRGTMGYIAPEVFSRNFGAVSSKSDVYSYGMMVLEMVAGRRKPNQHIENQSDADLPNSVYHQFTEAANLPACGVITEKEEIVKKMTIVGLWCIQSNPNTRPSISAAVEMLEGSASELPIPPKPSLCSPTRSDVTSGFGTSSMTSTFLLSSVSTLSY